MIFRKNKEEDLLGVSRKRLFDQGAFKEGLEELEKVSLEESVEKHVEKTIEKAVEKTAEKAVEEDPVLTMESESTVSIEVEEEDEVLPRPRPSQSVDMTQRLILSLEDQVAFLKEQLAVKDSQLGAKDELIRNFQVLIKQDQDTILMLENKLSETRKKPHPTNQNEETEVRVKENTPKADEVRYNEVRPKTASVETAQVPKVKKAPKAKVSFLAGLFKK